jgi:hypothetical protein
MGYTEVLDSVGESILQWADPETKYRGYTEVCEKIPTGRNQCFGIFPFSSFFLATERDGS